MSSDKAKKEQPKENKKSKLESGPAKTVAITELQRQFVSPLEMVQAKPAGKERQKTVAIKDLQLEKIIKEEKEEPTEIADQMGNTQAIKKNKVVQPKQSNIKLIIAVVMFLFCCIFLLWRMSK